MVRCPHLVKNGFNEQFHGLKREQLRHCKADQVVSAGLLLGSFHTWDVILVCQVQPLHFLLKALQFFVAGEFCVLLTHLLVFALRPVEESQLVCHLVANDGDMAKHYLLVELQLVVLVQIADLSLEQTEDALHDDGQNLVLDDVVLVLQTRRRVHADDVAHDLQVLGADARL